MNTVMDVIVAENIHKDYNGLKAVAGVSFKVAEKESFGILGPNGAGKSTMVGMIYGFSPLSSGHLTVLGLDISKHARAIKARLGVVPQENSLDHELTVLQNLLIYASYFNLTGSAARARAMELLKFFDLTAKAGARVEKLSGGMKRRLTIARALINNPDIMILDEPTTGLDPHARHLVWQQMRMLKDRGVTIVLTTHYLEEASQLCDRLIIMDRGVILDEGQPDELVHRHTGPEVLEVGGGALHQAEILSLAGALAREYLTMGDTLYVYPADGQALLASLQQLPHRFSRLSLRPATLEDVFLKLTGRGLQ